MEKKEKMVIDTYHGGNCPCCIASLLFVTRTESEYVRLFGKESLCDSKSTFPSYTTK